MDPEQLFEEFKQKLENTFAEAEAAIKAGESYSKEDILYIVSDIVIGFEEELENEGIDRPDLVLRAQDYAHEQYNQFNDLYPLQESGRRAPTGYESDDDEQSSVTGNTVLGFPIISEMECEGTEEASVRGQVLLTVEELSEYLDPVPESVIVGIVAIFDDNGEFQGFSLCGKKSTD